VDPVPDPLLLRRSGSAGNLTRDFWICSQEVWLLDHRGGLFHNYTPEIRSATLQLFSWLRNSLRLTASHITLQLPSLSELLDDWRFTANQFVLATRPLRLTISIFQLNTCGYSPYVTSSLTREWVCSLQLLLGLGSAVILRSVSRGTHDHILLSQIRDFPNLECLLRPYSSTNVWLWLHSSGFRP
jgi:hypothetical protein